MPGCSASPQRVLQWLVRQAVVPGEPAVDRTRKELLVPTCFIVGVVTCIWFVSVVLRPMPDDSKSRWMAAAGFRLSFALFSATLIPVGVYIVRTKRITRALCEFTVVCCSIGIIIIEVSFAFFTADRTSVIGLNVLALDVLLLCSCSDAITRLVLFGTAFWIVVTAVLNQENVSGDSCFDGPDRYTPYYFAKMSDMICVRFLVLFVDFKCTRGFARSMNEQKALVQASIDVTEAAVCLLSNYQTSEAAELLKGSDGQRLPKRLRTAMSRLVENLASYRAYLPQNCIPRGSLEDASTVRDPEAEEGAALVDYWDQVRSSTFADTSLSSSGDKLLTGGVSQQLVRKKIVSVVTVNSKGFLQFVDEHASLVAPHLQWAVDRFVGFVVGEGGVVDHVCGDHMSAAFNASRMCTTHRVSAARTGWNVTQPAQSPITVDASASSACVCSGRVLCGDFGNADVRRFMLLGPTFNTLLCLERVSAQMNAVLVEHSVGADCDVDANFVVVLVEQLRFEKRGPAPLMLWKLAGTNHVKSDPHEWMYELAERPTNPHSAWNRSLSSWLRSEGSFDTSLLDAAPFPVNAQALSGQRSQSTLREAGVEGDSVVFVHKNEHHEQ
eukprot:TRINITY_DN9030_c0_g1_i3.p1 TRINITY_DN9030_c0_g1~~TRINITY_DN9030_c0_g1_i3.p1  ORF type:complete len:628 (+),score=129.42 TRINITY_DN9030_c0_g1_i3:55-1884(+)